ncbi:hypothetical protein M5T07_04020 [Klebsiella pneumoniae]|uniref:hypothetical protein n=1 Tax=Klebsiella pneumoniae TaxID=573 RepID=UPI000ACE743D|nr:hypothetical protein [Klebsiella pneumoniae]UWA45747.1 hypothetical protein M5T07_04020 [Klebsiella pneumoniae]SWF38638.1 Uncharacterised protein [Klebsiella pneumoniae]HDK5456499.1 hypothetical protein [Klebsiella pneumoniae]HDU2742694.1 hypothetical protein [Klebsiella pneumoniae]HEE0564645.1 hypothetical protein [Klebsiella pneumoniae]
MEKITVHFKYKGEFQEITFEVEEWTYGCVLTQIAKKFDIDVDYSRSSIVAKALLKTNDFDNEFSISSNMDISAGKLHTLYLNRFARS